MRNYIPLFLTLLLALPMMSYAQRNCGAMEHLDQQLQSNPNLEGTMDEIEEHTKDFVREYDANARNVITIPVVVHVVYNTNAQNISDAQVLSQIDVLNEDFRRTNSDATNQWGQAADTQIEFCLASVDPNGNPTSGITRTSTGKRSFRTNDDVKKSSKGGVDPWSTSDYLNIWVCNLSNGILGYAQFPGGSPSTDGVVCLYNAFGRVGTLNSTFNLGRTTTHEVGHYLNLRHIWGDGGCSVDDFVSDTPTSDGANYGCASGHVSCGSVDMVENYMDYSNDACMNLFTAGQTARMRAVLAPGGFRYSLTQSSACGGGNTGGPTCSDGVQNGDETGVDCGGSVCFACPTCSDGVQNGDETGVDCGGSCPNTCQIGSCDAPTGLLSTARKNGREARLTWNAVAAASSYYVELRQVGATTWNNATLSATQIDATNLTKGATYEWRVRSNCGGATSDFANSTFVAGTSGRLSGELVNVMISHNPARDVLNVQITELANTDTQISLGNNFAPSDTYVSVSIVNVLGATLANIENTRDSEMTFNVSTYAPGVYFLRIEGEDGSIQVEKFIISK